jgi:Zn-dependent protease with chaperone function
LLVAQSMVSMLRVAQRLLRARERVSSSWVNWKRVPVVKTRASGDSDAAAAARPARVGALSSALAVARLLAPTGPLRLPAVVHARAGGDGGARRAAVQLAHDLPGVAPNHRLLATLIVLVGGSLAWWSAHRDVVDVTQRSRTMAVSVVAEKLLAEHLYGLILSEAEGQVVRHKDPRSLVLQRMFERLVQASPEARDAPWEWEMRVLEDPTVNAFAIMGGKLCVQSGLLEAVARWKHAGKVDSVRDAVAAVLGHEIGHCVARHAAEGLSWVPIQIPFFFFSFKSPLMLTVFEMYIKLPFSRGHEYEADKIGLSITARAGYDPTAARQLHIAMDQSSRVQEFVRTHPVGANRAAQLEELMPAAKLQYDKSVAASISARAAQASAGPFDALFRQPPFASAPHDPRVDMPSRAYVEALCDGVNNSLAMIQHVRTS